MGIRLDTRCIVYFVCLSIIITLLSCSYPPSEKIEKEAFDLGFTRQVITGQGFRHVAYFKGAEVPSKSLHVYLEGDGSPWTTHIQVAEDPTPHNPLMLHLMAFDSGPAVYLGRPCYYGLLDDPQCKTELWTSARYSEQIIASMVAALNSIMKKFAYNHVVLIGHSGGGTIAMLMAEHLPQTKGIITIAGNLDTEKWVNFHNYSPLYLSQNPSTRQPLSQKIYQLHLVGEYDQNILPEMILSATGHQPNIEVRVLKGFDHVCCWQDIWLDILGQAKNK